MCPRWRGSVGPVILRRGWAALVLLLSILPVACSTQNAARPPDPETVLQAIPPEDTAQYDHIQDMRKWRNPYLIVRADGVALYDSADSAEIILKTDQLLPTLAGLPTKKSPATEVMMPLVSVMP